MVWHRPEALSRGRARLGRLRGRGLLRGGRGGLTLGGSSVRGGVGPRGGACAARRACRPVGLPAGQDGLGDLHVVERRTVVLLAFLRQPALVLLTDDELARLVDVRPLVRVFAGLRDVQLARLLATKDQEVFRAVEALARAMPAAGALPRLRPGVHLRPAGRVGARRADVSPEDPEDHEDRLDLAVVEGLAFRRVRAFLDDLEVVLPIGATREVQAVHQRLADRVQADGAWGRRAVRGVDRPTPGRGWGCMACAGTGSPPRMTARAACSGPCGLLPG